MEPQQINFLKSISVSILCSIPETTHTVTGHEDILSFCKREIDFWNTIKSQLRPIDSWLRKYEHIRAKVSEIIKFIESTKEHESWKPRWDQFLNEINQIRPNPAHILSIEPTADCLRSIVLKAKGNFDQDVLNGALFYLFHNKNINLQQIDFNRSKPNLIGFLLAYEYEHSDSSSIVSRTKTEKVSLEQLRNSWKFKTDQLQVDYDKIISEHKTWSNQSISTWEQFSKKVTEDSVDLLNSKKTELQNLIIDYDKRFSDKLNVYEEQLRLSAATKFWNKRTLKYKTSGNKWLTSSISATVVVIILLFLCLYNMPEAFSHSLLKGDPLAIRGIIILATIISFGAYLIRLFVKMTLSSFHLERDSEEREQLTHVYLALVNENKIDKSERDFILQSLFSRADTGLLGNDSGPTMPGIDKN